MRSPFCQAAHFCDPQSLVLSVENSNFEFECFDSYSAMYISMPHFCRMFMQYVMRDIIMITPEFVSNLLKGKKAVPYRYTLRAMEKNFSGG